MKGRGFGDATELIKNATNSWEGFHKIASRNVSNTFRVFDTSVYLHKGTILKEM